MNIDFKYNFKKGRLSGTTNTEKCMKQICTILITLGILQGIIAQETGKLFSFQEEYPLTYYDSILLAGLPELDAIPVLKSADLPYSLDNSKYPYFRDIYEQVLYST